MVKKRNHYIPQFLLRRFASREAKGRHWLWQFRKGESPVEVVTSNAAVATFFYGQPETGVEDSLAHLEGEQAALLRDLDKEANPAERSRELRQFIWSLAFRTRALRGQFADVAERGLAQMGAVDSKMITDAVGREVRNNFDHHLGEILAKLSVQQQAAVKHLLEWPGMSEAVKEHARREAINAVPLVDNMLDQVAGVMQQAAQRGHIQALTRLFTEGKAIPTAFEVPTWSVEKFTADAVVLGDSVVFAVGPDGSSGALGRFTKDFAAIYIPISHASVLVGRRNDDVPVFGVHEINSASVQLSLDTFFASRNTEVERELTGQIGTGEPILSDDELRRIAEDSWKTLGRPRSEGLP